MINVKLKTTLHSWVQLEMRNKLLRWDEPRLSHGGKKKREAARSYF